MSVTTRPATVSDAEDITELMAELGYPSSVDAFHRRLEALLVRSDYYVVVAEHGGKSRGLGALHLFPTLQADGFSGLIAALVVSSAMRGMGVGRALVTDLEAYARGAECRRIIVTTANHRSGAHSFYERLGYEFTGRRYAKHL